METTIKTQFNLSKWIWLTVAGWIIGVVIIIGLGIITESTGLNLGGNSIVGIGMGAGVGWMQWIALKKNLVIQKNWIWFSVTGFTISYVAADVIISINDAKPDYYLPFATTAGALISGWLQYHFILKSHSSNAVYWVVFNVIAWAVAHFLTIGLYTLKLNFLPQAIQIILAFSFLLIAAPMLGFITGQNIKSILNNNNQQSN